jgi:ribonuclease BN (tRNA processing enzyme)
VSELVGRSAGAALTVLGSGTALQTERRGSPGYLLELAGQRLVLDLGPGVLRQLAKLGIPCWHLDQVFLTHAHIDHVADLVPLLFARHNPGLEDARDLIVHGWPGFLRSFESLRAHYGRWLEPRHGRLELRELDGRYEDPMDWRAIDRPMKHIPGARGLRVELSDGRCLAYSGDTDLCEQVIELGRDAELFVLECSFPDDQKVAGHLTPRECGLIARRSGCRRALLSHFYPVCDSHDIAAACAREWDGEIIIAEDGMRLEL